MDPLIVGMDRYAIASELAFYGANTRIRGGDIERAFVQGIGLMYERWTPADLQEAEYYCSLPGSQGYHRRDRRISCRTSGPVQDRY